MGPLAEPVDQPLEEPLPESEKRRREKCAAKARENHARRGPDGKLLPAAIVEEAPSEVDLIDKFVDDEPGIPLELKARRWALANYGNKATGTKLQMDLREDAEADRQKFFAELRRAEIDWERKKLGLAPEKEGAAAEEVLDDPGTEKSLLALEILLEGLKTEAEIEDVEPE